jgi:hypothetical protein
VRAEKHSELNNTTSRTAGYCEFTSDDCPADEFRDGGGVTMVQLIRVASNSGESRLHTAVAVGVPTARGYYARSVRYGSVSPVKV